MDLPKPVISSEHEPFARSVLAGLSRARKAVEPRWLYDEVGAKLFEAITKLDHYYPARTETALLEDAADDIADALGDNVAIVEPGSGEALKVRPLLGALAGRVRQYVPIDIAEAQLDSVAREMAALYPGLAVTPVAADFFQPFKTPPVDNAVVFFPGSTVGNMPPDEATQFLARLKSATGARRALIGFDLQKPWPILRDAYDDPAGVTSAFMKNVLQRMNRELGATFDLSAFGYRVRWNEEVAAVDMNLVARHAHSVSVAGQTFALGAGEEIHTEYSRKYTPERIAALTAGAGFKPVKTWTDDRAYFAVVLFEET